MSKARTFANSQRDLLHFIANPPPAPVPRALPVPATELMRLAGALPRTATITVEQAIEAATTPAASGKQQQRRAASTHAGSIPVAVRAVTSTRTLESALATCKLLANEVAIVASPRGMCFGATSTDRTMLCRATLAPATFITFKVDGDGEASTTTFHADLAPLIRALGRAGRGKDRDVVLRIGKGGAAASIGFHVARGMRGTITLARVAMDGGKGTKDATSLQLQPLPCTISVDRARLVDALRDARTCCHDVHVRIAGSRLLIESAGVEEGYATSLPVVAGEVLGEVDAGCFPAAALARIASALRGFKQPAIRLRTGQHAPLVFDVAMAGLALEVAVAPRVPGDEVEGEDGDDVEIREDEMMDDHAYQRDDVAGDA